MRQSGAKLIKYLAKNEQSECLPQVMPMDFLSTKKRAFNESCRPYIPVNAQYIEIGS